MTRQHLFDCIYCARSLPGAAFNREHVLSDAFGTFQNALVLHDCVCRECNDFFGKNLEVRFARDSFEALLRYETGVKRKAVHTPLIMPSVEITIGGQGTWSGVHVRPMVVPGGVEVALAPQAGFRRKHGDAWIYFPAAKVKISKASEFADLDTTTVRIFAPCEEQRSDLVSELARLGFRYEVWDEIERPFACNEKVCVDVASQINRIVRRCVAKYAFNYLAYSQEPKFVMSAAFDPVRQFIRCDVSPPWPVVVEHFGPILYDDSPMLRRTNGHLITVNWAASRVDIVSKVSLFNYLTYSVQLARRFRPPIWHPIRAGVHYNLRSRAVESLQSISGNILISRIQADYLRVF